MKKMSAFCRKTALGLAVIAALNSPSLYAEVLEVHYDATPAVPVLRILGNNFNPATSFVYVNNLRMLINQTTKTARFLEVICPVLTSNRPPCNTNRSFSDGDYLLRVTQTGTATTGQMLFNMTIDNNIGLKGDTGLQGLKGGKGDPGPQGPQGIPGSPGLKGDPGQKGDTGPSGVANHDASLVGDGSLSAPLKVADLLTRNIFNATSQYNQNSLRILVAPGSGNFFAGIDAGSANTTGGGNAFYGQAAGHSNTEGGRNTFMGGEAGLSNSTGAENTFIGQAAGYRNTSAFYNVFAGTVAGLNNTTGERNTFIGHAAGLNNSTGSANTFVGQDAGNKNTTASGNAFFGFQSGLSNTTGNANTFIGPVSGVNTTTGNLNTFVGEESGSHNTEGAKNTFIGQFAGTDNTTGTDNTALGEGANVAVGNLDHATAIGAGAQVATSNTIVLGRPVDTVSIPGALLVNGALPKGDKGDPGATGATGATGAPGISGYQIAPLHDTIASDLDSKTIYALCPAGKKVLGGGCSSNSALVTAIQSYPNGGDDQWGCAFSTGGTHIAGSVYAISVYAICANVQ